MRYYKAFNRDLKCRGMQYEIGKVYVFDGKPIPCKQGFHFCKNINDVYRFYNTSEDTRVCEVKPLGEIVTDDGIKFCTNELEIVKEIINPRLKTNLSDGNTGFCNSGGYNTSNFNSGNRNTGSNNTGSWNSGDYNNGFYNGGDYNSGNSNTGNWNSGSYNSGYFNSGIYNSGDYNGGNWNSGDHNTGNHNSGYFNSGYYSAGVFNTEKEPKIKMFDKETNWTMLDWVKSKACGIMGECPFSCYTYIYETKMTDKEKEEHPEYKTVGGYLKFLAVTVKDRQEWWDKLSDDNKEVIYNLPNFDAKKFKRCTGIEVCKDDNKEEEEE